VLDDYHRAKMHDQGHDYQITHDVVVVGRDRTGGEELRDERQREASY